MKTIFSILSASLILSGASVCRGTIIVADDFNRADSSSLGTTSTGGFAWNEQETVSTGLRIAGNQLAAGSTTAGREYATVNLSGASGYSTTLANNAGLVTWSINMRSTRSNPSGFDAGNYGMAFVLAANSSDFTTGSGYAVVLGNSGTPDPIRLANFSNGLDLNSQFNDMILTTTGFNAEYLNVRVTYDPNGPNSWSLYLTSSSTSFSDPTAVTTQIGNTTADATHTSIALDYSGILWNHSTGADSATFDNFSITAVPEPVTWALIVFGALFGAVQLGRIYRRHRAAC